MQCKATTKSGKPCRAAAVKNSKFCMIHAPHLGAKRAQARKRGGQTHRTPHGASAEILPDRITSIQDAQKILDYVMRELLPMDNSIQRARVLIALFEAYARALEVGEIEARLGALEAGRVN